MPEEYKPKVKFFITTKADLATDKINKWLEENYDKIDVMNIKPFMSYTFIGAMDKGAYMIGCMIEYLDIERLPMDIPDIPQPFMNWKEESDGVSA